MNAKLSNSQLNKLKSVIRNSTELALNFLSNIIGDSNDNFPHKLLLTDRKVSKLCEAFENSYHQLIQNYQKLICPKQCS